MLWLLLVPAALAGDTVLGIGVQNHATRYVDMRGARLAVRVRVAVEHPGGELALRAGESWPIEEPASTAPEPVVAPVAPVAPKRVAQQPVEPEPAEELESTVATAFAGLLDLVDAHDPEALAAVDAFLLAHPAGPLTVEAEVLRLQVLARTSPAQAERAAAAWLSANPRSARRPAVLWLHGTIARDGLRDCALALPTYRELAETGPRPAEAAAYQGLCALALGRREEARAALRRLLEGELAGPLEARVTEALGPL